MGPVMFFLGKVSNHGAAKTGILGFHEHNRGKVGKKTWGGWVKKTAGYPWRKCLKFRDFGVDSLDSHDRHLLDVVYIWSIDPLRLCRTWKPWVLGLAGATCTCGDQAAIRDRKKRKLVGKGRSWTEVAKKSVTREVEWSKASQSPHLLGCTPQHP